MPVEDPKALAQTYLAKHNIEKIFEVGGRSASAAAAAADVDVDCACARGVCVRVCVRACVCVCVRWDPVRICKPMCSSIGQRMCAST